jgi:hypothetical protein
MAVIFADAEPLTWTNFKIAIAAVLDQRRFDAVGDPGCLLMKPSRSRINAIG